MNISQWKITDIIFLNFFAFLGLSNHLELMYMAGDGDGDDQLCLSVLMHGDLDLTTPSPAVRSFVQISAKLAA